MCVMPHIYLWNTCKASDKYRGAAVCHTQMSHVPYESWPIWMRQILWCSSMPHTNESCPIWVMTHMNETNIVVQQYATHKWVMSHMSHVPYEWDKYMNETNIVVQQYATLKWVMSHMSHVPYEWDKYRGAAVRHTQMSHVPYEWDKYRGAVVCHTWCSGMPHTNESCPIWMHLESSRHRHRCILRLRLGIEARVEHHIYIVV